MNWIIRFGQWWEDHRSIRKPAFETLRLTNNAQFDVIKKWMEDIEELSRHSTLEVDELKKGIEEMKKTSEIPSGITKEIVIQKVRLDRLELYVGLKRDPKPTEVPGAARIS